MNLGRSTLLIQKLRIHEMIDWYSSLSAEELLASIRDKGLHDLRGGLRHVSGFSKLMNPASGLQEEEVREMGETVSAACDRLSLFEKRLGQLLDATTLPHRNVCFPRLTDLELSLRENEASWGNVLWNVEGSGGVEVDAGLLHRILSELLSNASRFGSKPTTVRLIGLADGLVELRVEDAGAGIAPEMRDRLVSPFQRGVTPQHSSGAGMGLAICRQVAGVIGARFGLGELNGGQQGLLAVVRMDSGLG